MPIDTAPKTERAILVGIATPKVRPWLAQERLEELHRLADTAGAEVAQTFLQRVQAFSPATLIGEGSGCCMGHSCSILNLNLQELC